MSTSSSGATPTSGGSVISGTTQYVSSGVVSGSTILGLINVTYQDYIVSNGGQVVTGSGVASATVVSGMVRPIDNNSSYAGTDETQTIQSGGTSYDTQLKGDDVIYNLVAAGMPFIRVTGVGSQAVSSGGLAYNDVIDADGLATVSSGGIVSGATISGINQPEPDAYYFQYGSQTRYLRDDPYANGMLDVQSGGSATSITILNHGQALVESGGTATQIDIDGGTLSLQSGAITPTPIAFESGMIELDGFAFGSGVSATFNAADELTVSGIDGTRAIQMSAIAPGASEGNGQFGTPFYFMQAPDGSGTDIVLGTPCFCRGTLIATPCGERPVENLAIGDEITTNTGASRTIRWIGCRSYDARFALGNRDILPILIRQGALGHQLPKRDLFLSPLHAMYLDGVLVPAFHLIDGTSIIQIAEPDEIDYFHIELDSHDILLAEGAPSESFIDDDSRGMFHNAADYYARYPDTKGKQAALYCAPRIESGPHLEAIRAELAAARVQITIDVRGPHTIEGWAIALGGQTHIRLEVLADGRHLGFCQTTQPRPDVARHLGSANLNCGFVFGLPRHVDPHTLTVTLAKATPDTMREAAA